MKYIKSFIALLLAVPVLVVTALWYVIGRITDTSDTLQPNVKSLKFWRLRVAANVIIDGIGLLVTAAFFFLVYAIGFVDDWANGTLEMDAELRAREG